MRGSNDSIHRGLMRSRKVDRRSSRPSLRVPTGHDSRPSFKPPPTRQLSADACLTDEHRRHSWLGVRTGVRQPIERLALSYKQRPTLAVCLTDQRSAAGLSRLSVLTGLRQPKKTRTTSYSTAYLGRVSDWSTQPRTAAGRVDVGYGS